MEKKNFRRCHLLRNVSTNFRRFRPGDTCDCAQVSLNSIKHLAPGYTHEWIYAQATFPSPSQTIHCICQCSPRRLIFDSLADDNGCRPKRGIDLETLEFDKLAELLTIIREEKGGITEEDLDNATGVLMSDLGGPHKFNWFQFDKWCVRVCGCLYKIPRSGKFPPSTLHGRYTANYENELALEADGEAFMKQMKDP